MKLCSVLGCGKKHHAKGLCAAHRQSEYRNGERGSPEYNTWRAMIARCFNQNNNRYAMYGGRGVSVRDSWRSYESFLADMGRKPGPEYSLERINRDGHYEPSNCRWATRTEQARNKSNNRHATVNGVVLPLVVAAEQIGISYKAAHHRLTRGTLK